MTSEDTILQLLMGISTKQGEIAGRLDTLIEADADHRLHIGKLYELHRTCVGPHLEARVEALAAELHKHEDDTTTVRTKTDPKIDRASLAPGRRGATLNSDDLRTLAKAAPLIIALLGGAVGVSQCQPAPLQRASAADIDTARSSQRQKGEPKKPNVALKDVDTEKGVEP